MAMPMILPPRQFRMGALYWNDLWEGVLGNGECPCYTGTSGYPQGGAE